MKKFMIFLCLTIICFSGTVKADYRCGSCNNGVYQATGILNLVGASLNTLNALVGQPTVVVSQPVYTTQVVAPVPVQVATPQVIIVQQPAPVVYTYPVYYQNPIYYNPSIRYQPYPQHYQNNYSPQYRGGQRDSSHGGHGRR